MQFDLIALLVNWLLILIYYLYLSQRVRREPDSSVYALNAKVRERWVDMVMNKGNMEILAVQTLRNSVMAANFMASLWFGTALFNRIMAIKIVFIAAGFFRCFLLFFDGDSLL